VSRQKEKSDLNFEELDSPGRKVTLMGVGESI